MEGKQRTKHLMDNQLTQFHLEELHEGTHNCLSGDLLCAMLMSQTDAPKFCKFANICEFTVFSLFHCSFHCQCQCWCQEFSFGAIAQGVCRMETPVKSRGEALLGVWDNWGLQPRGSEGWSP